MLRSFMSGIAGMKSYQTKMDVIGNNVANVNTIGFKASSVNFSDVFYQNIQSATSSSIQTQKSGTNSKQIGYGSAIASINNTVSTQGGSQTTSRALDMMINGNAFFIIGMDGQNYFTKNGAFDIDGSGYLSTESGGLVMGWNVDNETGNIVQDTVSPIQIWSPENSYAAPKGTTDTYFQGNIDSNNVALEKGKIIQMDFYDNLGNQYSAKYKVVSKNAEDNNEYEVILTDIIDSNEQSIFVNAKTSNGQTIYSLKDDVSVDFAGYTYKAVDVNKVTGAVKLQSYNIDGTETEDTVIRPAHINIGKKQHLFKLDGLQFKPITDNDIYDYFSIDKNGTVSINNLIDEVDEFPFFFNIQPKLVAINDNAHTYMTYPSDYLKSIISDYYIGQQDYLDSYNNGDPINLPYYYDQYSNKLIPYTNAGDVFIEKNGTYVYLDEVKSKINNSQIFVRSLNGDLKFLLPNNSDSRKSAVLEKIGRLLKNGILNAYGEKLEQSVVNKGANLLFNASTGKFASATSAVTRFDENGNPIINSVSLKIHTSDSQIDTSAKDLFNEINVDFSSLTMYSDGGNSNINSVRGQIGTAGEGAGYQSGTLTGVSVSNDGKIYGKYDNGIQKILGQIAVTSFANPTGLEAKGNSLFQTTVNSGDFDGVGNDVMAIGLSISAGSLETSNVDLSNEFTNMVTTQRGYEANSKVINTSDRIIESLINLKR